MKHEEVNEIIECLGGEKRIFHYYKDRFCLDDLEHEMKKRGLEKLSINAIRQSRMSKYLDKAIIKQHANLMGSGELLKEHLNLMTPAERETFVLELSSWGNSRRGWDQTTRNQCNLVLRLNFSESMNRQYEKLIRPSGLYGPFEYWGHPVSCSKRKTLSWVRMDVSFDSDEVLIEEVQNDWLRRAKGSLNFLRRRMAKDPEMRPSDIDDEIGGSYANVETYIETVLKPYYQLWAEASLCAAINFIRQDLGISNIYYHSFDTGIKIKQVVGKPPRSMYTKLPKQFGFELVKQAPDFLIKDKTARRYLQAINKKQSAEWHRLV